jgi:DNA-binding transcriptional MerR regulator/methylmalonyl-CoA mutase cobalamin-binding subunit
LGKFSIKDIESVTGIKSHTIRMWEQRYNIVTPKRTETNIRYYDDEDLKLFLNIVTLNNHGIKISEIAKLSHDKIQEAVVNLKPNFTEYSSQIRSLIVSMLSFDEFDFHKVLSKSIIQYGLEQTMVNIIFPFLHEVGVLWQVGSIQPAHEHFVTNIIKQKLYVSIDGQIGTYSENRKRFLLFLPENEQHSLGLLFANYIIRNRGHEVIYLGQEVPVKDLKISFDNGKVDYIFSTITCATFQMDKQEMIDYLSANWPESHIFLTGSQILNANVKCPANVRIINSISEFVELVNSLSSINKKNLILQN